MDWRLAYFHMLSEARVRPALIFCCFPVFRISYAETPFCFPYIMDIVLGAGVLVYTTLLHRIWFSFVWCAEDALQFSTGFEEHIASSLVQGAFELV